MNLVVRLWNKFFGKKKPTVPITENKSINRKSCTSCHKSKILSNKYFSLNRKMKSGFNSACKKCHNKNYQLGRKAKPKSSNSKKIERKCNYCNDIFYAYKSEVNRGSGLYCNKKCLSKAFSILRTKDIPNKEAISCH